MAENTNPLAAVIAPQIVLSEHHTLNIDVAYMVLSLDRAIAEVCGAQSSPLNHLRRADVERMNYHLDRAESYLEFSERMPESDQPRSHPVQIYIGAPAKIPMLNSLDLWRLVQFFDTTRFEIAHSGSTLAPNGASKKDRQRWKSYIVDCRMFLNEYAVNSIDADFPETTPRFAPVGQGVLPG